LTTNTLNQWQRTEWSQEPTGCSEKSDRDSRKGICHLRNISSSNQRPLSAIIFWSLKLEAQNQAAWKDHAQDLQKIIVHLSGAGEQDCFSTAISQEVHENAQGHVACTGCRGESSPRF